MHTKPLLIIGGPADGQRVVVDARARTYSVPSLGAPIHSHSGVPEMALEAADIVYAIGTVQGAFLGVFHVGVQNLSDCVICALLAGYRKTVEHYTDLNVAEQLVTLLGGKGDGQRVTVPSNCVFIPESEFGTGYQVVPLICKDGRVFRVGVTDMLNVDPIQLLIEGYRK